MGNVLRRMSMEIPAVQEADTSSVEFAKKVQDELGYSRLLVAVRTPPAKPLLKALKGIDITPFDIEDVKAYKKSQEYIGMWSGTKEKLKYLAIAVVLIFPLVLNIINWYDGFDWVVRLPPKYQEFLQPALISESGLVLTVVLTALNAIALLTAVTWLIPSDSSQWGRGERVERHWKLFTLSTFDKDIEPFVLEKALEISRACPTAQLLVEALVETKGQKALEVIEPDPFLVVINGSESYYVEVWDEKKYEEIVWAHADKP